MESIFAKIRQETTNFTLGDEEVSRWDVIVLAQW